jgi:hypothetical protein
LLLLLLFTAPKRAALSFAAAFKRKREERELLRPFIFSLPLSTFVGINVCRPFLIIVVCLFVILFLLVVLPLLLVLAAPSLPLPPLVVDVSEKGTKKSEKDYETNCLHQNKTKGRESVGFPATASS